MEKGKICSFQLKNCLPIPKKGIPMEAPKVDEAEDPDALDNVVVGRNAL